ncbi:Iojap protein [Lachnospiraceae bacterium TWA4]|nr:Iojap protein [Lachnospiraceae bacterium TWA4]
MDRIKEIVKIAYAALDEKMAEEITVIDISKVSTIADYFMIANGRNSNQVQAIVDEVTEKLGRAGFNYRQIEGYNEAKWVLLDYQDVVIHIFASDDRRFYDLERIWRDGALVDMESL